MAVIINEMEVVLETPKRPGVDPERLPAPSTAPLRPLDLHAVLERQMQKEARILAH
jgi:hypothetical protein